MTALPRLHVVTDDDVLARDRFAHQAMTLIAAHGSAIALHLRGPRTPTRTLFRLAERLGAIARETGAVFLVNDRVDVALAAHAHGVQLGQRSMAPADARRLGPGWRIGVSVHGVDEAADAIAAGTGAADFLVVGSIWETDSHPGRPGAGTGLVRDVQALGGPPVVAIGGITPERARVARSAGAAGVAVLSGVWDADPARAAARYLEALADADPAAADPAGAMTSNEEDGG